MFEVDVLLARRNMHVRQAEPMRYIPRSGRTMYRQNPHLGGILDS